MIGFVILFVILVFFLQQWILEHTPEAVDANFWPEDNVVDPDEGFNIVIELKNKERFPLYFIRVQSLFANEFQVKDNKISFSTWLKAKQKLQFKVPVAITKRGRYIIKNPLLFFGDFLGIREKRRELSLFREVVVAPREYEAANVTQVLGKFLGEYSVRRFIFEDPVLTLGFREYSGREPMKMISWKQSAQRQTLMVKEYDHTIEPVLSVLVNVETLNENASEQIEKTFSIARSVCSNLEAKGISYDVYTNASLAGGDSFTITEGLGARHFSKVMELLGRSMTQSAFSYAKLLKLARETGGRERGLVIITPDDTVLTTSASDSQTLYLNATSL